MDEPTPTFLPKPEHLAYLANLLTVLGILYAAWTIHRRSRRANKGAVAGGPGFTFGNSS